jgi:tetraacyldisaccharide 4'-kinase
LSQSENDIRDVMSGSATGLRAAALRVALGAVEPIYAAAVRLRNQLFDRGFRKIHRLSVPVVSIGNLTTGGTGKTPMVGWLAGELRRAARRPAVLSRGYGNRGAGLGDELTMLARMLNDGFQPEIFLRANPDRVAAATALLREHPQVDFIVLDDGFQHRRIARDLDIVLISAANPFGFDHVLPRGLLREPLSGLARVGALVITHADQVSSEDLAAIESRVRRYAPAVPIHRARHEQFALREGDAEHSIEKLASRSYFVFSGIADPKGLVSHLSKIAKPAGERDFGDHHNYTCADVEAIDRAARDAGADLLVTTEKDWVKIESFKDSIRLPIWRVQMRIRFLVSGERALLGQVLAVSSRA